MSRLAAAGLLLAASAAQAQPAPLPVGLFGNMIQSRADGDVEGVEIRIARLPQGYRAIFSYGEGGCDAPVTGALTADGDRWQFNGTMSDSPGSAPVTVRFWLRRDTGGLRLFASEQTSWIAVSPQGDRLRPVRRARCLR